MYVCVYIYVYITQEPSGPRTLKWGEGARAPHRPHPKTDTHAKQYAVFGVRQCSHRHARQFFRFGVAKQTIGKLHVVENI